MYRSAFKICLLFVMFDYVVADEDFLGCGGFVQVAKEAALDLSKVEIRL